MGFTTDHIRSLVEKHKSLQNLYNGTYRLLLPKHYRHYLQLAQKEADEFGISSIDPDDMVRETIVFGTFFDEYLLYGFHTKSSEVRRTYLTDSVRNRLCSRINNSEMQKLLMDKFQCYRYFKPYYRRESILFDSRNTLIDAIGFAKLYREVVVKPLKDCAGRGIELHTYDAETSPQYFKQLLSTHKPYIIEERIIQHPTLAQWHPASINTIRVNTILKDNRFTIFNAFIRTGRNGSFVDNGAQGGLFATIDPQNGKIITEACDEHGNTYASHPESHIPYIGTQIPYWDELKDLSKQLAHNIPELVYVGWDLALTPDGWVMVEGNKGQFVAQQLTLKHGLRKDFEALVGA